jgi:hypothetical protein
MPANYVGLTGAAEEKGGRGGDSKIDTRLGQQSWIVSIAGSTASPDAGCVDVTDATEASRSQKWQKNASHKLAFRVVKSGFSGMKKWLFGTQNRPWAGFST